MLQRVRTWRGSRAAAAAALISVLGLLPLATPAAARGPEEAGHRCRCPSVEHECHCTRCRAAERAERAALAAQPPCHRHPSRSSIHLPPPADGGACRMGGCGEPDPDAGRLAGPVVFLLPPVTLPWLAALAPLAPPLGAPSLPRPAAPPVPPPRRLA